MLIEIHNLTKVYKGKTKALDDVSFTIPNGLFGLIGRNGAGKTTLMRILTTVMRPSAGQVLCDGKDIFANLEEYRSSLGFLPQSTKLIPSMNIMEFLDYMCVLKGIKDKSKREEEIKRCVSLAGLEGEEKKRLSKYSGGMLRRAGIAQALIGDPKLLIVDEPTTGLDPEEQLYFLNMLSKIGSDRTVLFSTHIIQDVENICENVCVIEKGSVMYLGSVQGLLDKVKGQLWECTAKPEDEQMLRQKAIVSAVTYAKGKPVVRYVAEQSLYENSQPQEPQLEDAFIYTLGGIKR